MKRRHLLLGLPAWPLAAAAQDLVEQAEGAAVHVVAGDHVVTGAEQLHDGGGGGHAGAEGEAEGLAVVAALERRDGALERVAGGVVGAAVLEAERIHADSFE